MGWGLDNPGGGAFGGGWQQTPTPTQPQQPTAPWTPEQAQLANSLNFYQGSYGPNLIQNDINQQQLMGQIGFAGADYNLQAGNLRQNYGTDAAQLALQQQGVGRQIGANDRLADLARQLSDLDIQNLQGRVIGQGRQFDAQTRGLKSDATSRGSLGGGNIGLMQNLSDVQANKSDAYSQFLRDVAGVNINQQKNDVNFAEQKAQLEDRAKGYGISGQELKNHLNQGLAKLGIDKQMTFDTLMSALASGDVQQMAIAQEIYRAALEHSELFPNYMQGLPFTGGGGGSSRGAGASGSWGPSTSTPVSSTQGRGVGRYPVSGVK